MNFSITSKLLSFHTVSLHLQRCSWLQSNRWTHSFWIFLCRNAFSTKTTDSKSSVFIKIQLELIIVLNLKRIKCLSQPFHVSGWQTITQEANPVLWRKLYCCYSPTYPTQNIFLFGLSFSSFLFFGLLRRPPQIYRIWLIWFLQKVSTRSC